MAFGRLLREGNAEFNGKKATAKVLVVSDFEHKCFNINFELIVGLVDQIKNLLGADGVKTAKEILEWLGLLGIGVGASKGGHMTYLRYLEWRRGREVVEEKTESDKTGMVRVTIVGDGNSVNVHPSILNLSRNPKALRATRETFLPLGGNGFDTMRVAGQADVVPDEFTADKIDNIVASCNAGIEDSEELPDPEVEETSAWLSVYSPVYDLKADSWRFRLGREIIYADISGTNIAAEAMKRGGALSEDSYLVRLEITTNFDEQGAPGTPSYRILDVSKFVPGRPAVQQSLIDPRNISGDGTGN